MTDIIDRLRAVAAMDLRRGFVAHTMDTAGEAIAEIARLRAEMARIEPAYEELRTTVNRLSDERQCLLVEVARLRAVLEEIARGDAFGSIWQEDAKRALEQNERSGKKLMPGMDEYLDDCGQ